MAASFVLRGALHEGLFYDTSGEMYCVYAKFKPFLAAIRHKLPYFLLTVEKVILRTEEGRQRLERLERSLSRRRLQLAGHLTGRGDGCHRNSLPDEGLSTQRAAKKILSRLSTAAAKKHCCTGRQSPRPPHFTSG